MATGKQAVVRRAKMAERARHQKEEFFPEYPEEWLWHRTTNDGYTTIPRALPIAMQIIDSQSKGQPAGHVLFCLWARSPDHPLVTIENPATFAAEAGFQGERAVDTWRRRMKKLKELNFIATHEGPSGDFHYVLLLNPNVAVEWMNCQQLVQKGQYVRFKDRILEIGAYGDIDVWLKWSAVQQAAFLAQQAVIATESNVPPPPPPEVASYDIDEIDELLK